MKVYLQRFSCHLWFWGRVCCFQLPLFIILCIFLIEFLIHQSLKVFGIRTRGEVLAFFFMLSFTYFGFIFTYRIQTLHWKPLNVLF